MKRLNKIDIEIQSRKRAIDLMSVFGLDNAIKISMEIRRKLLAEKGRRK